MSVPYVLSYWNNLVSNLNWRKIWCLPYKYIIVNKVKEVSLKIIHRFYPCKRFLQRYKKDIDVSCSFCNNSLENLHHLFCSCHLSCAFWQKLCTSFPQKIDFNFTLSYEDVLFGSFSYDPAKSDQYYIINLIVLLAKYHIHKCKFSSQKPLFLVFVKELKQYLTIQRSQNKKAVKTTDLCLLFNSY